MMDNVQHRDYLIKKKLTTTILGYNYEANFVFRNVKIANFDSFGIF